MVETSDKKHIVVIDIPSTSTAEEAAEMLNAVCDRGYYMRMVTPGLDGGAARAYFASRAQPEQKEPKPIRNTDGKDDDALAIIRAHIGDPISHLVRRLQAVGIKRGKTWVADARIACRS